MYLNLRSMFSTYSYMFSTYVRGSPTNGQCSAVTFNDSPLTIQCSTLYVRGSPLAFNRPHLHPISSTYVPMFSSNIQYSPLTFYVLHVRFNALHLRSDVLQLTFNVLHVSSNILHIRSMFSTYVSMFSY